MAIPRSGGTLLRPIGFTRATRGPLQLLQAVGYTGIYEEGRRQKPVCNAVACWVFNEPWPRAANNSLVAWPNELKPSYYAVAAANRPVIPSARIPRFDWPRGGELSTTLFLLNDSPHSIGALVFSVRLVAGDESTALGTWQRPGTKANMHCAGPVVRGFVPVSPGQTSYLVVEVTGRPEFFSCYTLAFAR